MADIKRGFNENYITGGDEYNNLLRRTSNPIQPINQNLIDKTATERAYNQNQLINQQYDDQLQNTLAQADKLKEQSLAQSSQSGLGLGAFHDLQNEELNKELERNKEFAREANRSMVGEERALNIENMKSRLTQQAMQTMNRKFVGQLKDIQKDFTKYQKTSVAKFGQELRNYKYKQQLKSERAWNSIATGLERASKGGEIGGGIVGGVAGLIGAIYSGNPQLVMAGIQAGRGTGKAIGTLGGRSQANRTLSGY